MLDLINAPVRVAPQSTPSSPAESLAKARRPRLYVLDGLRLLAALAVMAYHYLAFGGGSRSGPWGDSPHAKFPVASEVASYGWLGVEFFFLISGFVICMSCWGTAPRDFLLSRVTRLYPAYWCAVLATAAIVSAWPIVDTHPKTKDVLTNLTMLQNPLGVDDLAGVYWSLWAELRFYLLFAVLVVLGLTYRRVVIFCVVWATAGLLLAYVDFPILDMLAMPKYAPFFIGGIVMYLMYRFEPTPLLFALLGCSWFLAQRQLPQLVDFAEKAVGHRLSYFTCLAVVTSAFLVILAVSLGKLSRCQWRWLTIAGALTYPLYLLHEDIGWTAIGLWHQKMPSWLLLGSLVTALLLASWLVHRCIERPIGKIAKRLVKKKARHPEFSFSALVSNKYHRRLMQHAGRR